MNTAEFLQMSSYVVPDREALVSGDTRITYQEMVERTNRLANALQDMGMSRGDKLAVMAVNSAEYVETYYACAKLGVALVPLNYRAKNEELTYMVNTSDASTLFVGERYLELLSHIRGEIPGVKNFVCFERAVDGMQTYAELMAKGSPEDLYVEVDDNDATILIFTSGTTAMPKGVVLTYLTLTAYVINTMEPAMPEVHDVTMVTVPLFHIAGSTAMMTSIWGGRTLVILPQYEPELYLQTVQKEKVTHSFVVPTMLKRLMEHPKFSDYDLSSLKLITYGAAPMPYEVVRKAVETFHCGLMNAYGQTESTSSLTYLGPEDHEIHGLPDAEREKKLHRLRSVGRPMDDVEVAILNEKDEILAMGEEGEICVSGARVMREYFKQEEATQAAIHDGWLHTGDVGYLDEDRYLFITGRKKDVIIRGGENVSPGEIEAVLEEHHAVDEVAVIGVPDVEWGEEIKAIVVLKSGQTATADELRAYCKSRLASYKVPRYITFVDELLRNALGKVLKTDIRKQHGTPDER
jgi:acyl-CoA synthetase (AMP-forming)/AMP-acid ligase II